MLFFKGGDTQGLFDKDTGIKADKLGRAPLMLPAIHDATVTDFSSGPLPAPVADTVWHNNTGAPLLLGGGVLSIANFPYEALLARVRAHARKPFPAETLRFVRLAPDALQGVRGAGLYAWARPGR